MAVSPGHGSQSPVFIYLLTASLKGGQDFHIPSSYSISRFASLTALLRHQLGVSRYSSQRWPHADSPPLSMGANKLRHSTPRWAVMPSWPNWAMSRVRPDCSLLGAFITFPHIQYVLPYTFRHSLMLRPNPWSKKRTQRTYIAILKM